MIHDGDRVEVNVNANRFYATISGVTSRAYIVAPEVWEPWMDRCVDKDLDPPGCIVVMKSACSEITDK